MLLALPIPTVRKDYATTLRTLEKYFTGLSGGSGGISSVYSLPSWQQNVYGVGLSSNFTSTSNRNMPDVSLFASDGGINGFLVWQHALLFCESDLAPCDFSTPEYALSMAAGGTSFTAPMMGGILGLINQADVPAGSGELHTIRAGGAGIRYAQRAQYLHYSSQPVHLRRIEH